MQRVNSILIDDAHLWKSPVINNYGMHRVPIALYRRLTKHTINADITFNLYLPSDNEMDNFLRNVHIPLRGNFMLMQIDNSALAEPSCTLLIIFSRDVLFLQN